MHRTRPAPRPKAARATRLRRSESRRLPARDFRTYTCRAKEVDKAPDGRLLRPRSSAVLASTLQRAFPPCASALSQHTRQALADRALRRDRHEAATRGRPDSGARVRVRLRARSGSTRPHQRRATTSRLHARAPRRLLLTTRTSSTSPTFYLRKMRSRCAAQLPSLRPLALGRAMSSSIRQTPYARYAGLSSESAYAFDSCSPESPAATRWLCE